MTLTPTLNDKDLNKEYIAKTIINLSERASVIFNSSLKNATKKEVYDGGYVRGLQRYNVVRKTSSNQFVIIEINAKKMK